MQSINPATEEVLRTFRMHSCRDIEESLSLAAERYRDWRRTSFAERSGLLRSAAAYLREHNSRMAAIMTAEMGKPIVEAEAEVEKCAWGCDYYADNAEKFLAAEPRESSGRECYLQYAPLGTILAVMPWNLPFWQVFRFAAPALMAGNTALLKHASNVPQCSLAVEEVFRESGYPPGCFRSLLISGAAAAAMIEDPRIAAVTLTGSEAAGSAVAARAGSAIKKTVLELGGSDPFIVLEDADIGAAVSTGVRARYQNTGQSCIAAKRFIVVARAYGEYRDRFAAAVGQLKVGNPDDRSTQIGPLARRDLIDDLERQVEVSVARGARLLAGGRRIPGRGYFFEPTVLADVPPDAPASCEEVFGPVAALMSAADPAEAVRIANSSAYGLGASLWTADLSLARTLARDIETGQVFINGMVASDPRLPFGGIKRSGYGRELSELGIREFTNMQTVWIGP
ncbi:MAG: NAD-dependent succinate-semialdehyde dehydrogenase, partial [Acidobacteria bacterium]|nr:NAD-dependent succinate-semialdehyde dehydrogenase [Acidobacteriota bacterium]